MSVAGVSLHGTTARMPDAASQRPQACRCGVSFIALPRRCAITLSGTANTMTTVGADAGAAVLAGSYRSNACGP